MVHIRIVFRIFESVFMREEHIKTKMAVIVVIVSPCRDSAQSSVVWMVLLVKNFRPFLLNIKSLS